MPRFLFTIALALLVAPALPGSAAAWSPARGPELAMSTDLSELSLEQLGNVRVTSVSRRDEHLSAAAAAAVFVLTSEDIRRSGAKTIPDALRLVPTLQVARADANQWAISGRGFNSVLANKMLVLIDNRVVYSPLFSGVFWEAQDVLLEDVDRIEVISGPGGTSWGTNAVNGVINIITRTAEETRGVLAAGGGGSERRIGEARIGWGARPVMRVYGKFTDQEHAQLESGTPIRDASQRFQGGGRLRWADLVNVFQLDGGVYSSSVDQAVGDRDVSGWHLLGRWTREPARGGRLQLQAYYDFTRRDQPGAIFERLDTWDVDLHHEIELGRHDLVWGAGYRFQPDRVDNLGAPGFALIPDDRDLRYADVFAEDAIRLADPLTFTAGVRFEHDVWTGWEHLPTLRLAWQPSAANLFWTAASRAVRAPARVDRDFFSPASPPHVFLAGGPGFQSEILDEIEAGWRAQPHPSVSWSIDAFGGRYDRLRSIELGTDGPEFANGIRGTLHGVEAWANWRVMTSWRLSAGGFLQRKALFVKAGHTDLGGAASLGDDPDHQWSARSAFDLGPHVELDLMGRHVGALSQIPNYSTLDARLAVRLGTAEASVTGYDLVGPRHAEWGSAASHATFGRRVFAELQWRL